MRVGIVTCKVLPEPDPDQEPLIEALRAAGADAELLPWDDDSADPADFDLCVIRSTWNYYRQPEAYERWLVDADKRTTLLNPLGVMQRNMHKGYLDELRDAGIPVIPTAFVEKGGPASVEAVLDERGWDDVVIKPAVSAASYKTRRYRKADLDGAQGFLEGITTDRDAMIQKFMPEVQDSGERCMVWIAGEFTHSIRKEPRFDDGEERVSDAIMLDDEELAFGERVMSLVEGELLYGRVDVIRDHDGGLRLSELELLEPSLFLIQHPPAMERLVEAIVERARDLHEVRPR